MKCPKCSEKINIVPCVNCKRPYKVDVQEYVDNHKLYCMADTCCKMPCKDAKLMGVKAADKDGTLRPHAIKALAELVGLKPNL